MGVDIAMWQKFILEHGHREGGEPYCNIKLSAEHAAFKGHFPNNPLFPAVFHIAIMRELAEMELKTPLQLLSIHKAKFTAKLLPEQEITLAIKKIKKVGFSYTFSIVIELSGNVVSSATLEFIPAVCEYS